MDIKEYPELENLQRGKTHDEPKYEHGDEATGKLFDIKMFGSKGVLMFGVRSEKLFVLVVMLPSAAIFV